MPDGIECHFNIAGEADDDVKQHYQTHTDEDSAVRVLQIGVDERKHMFCQFRIHLQGFAHIVLYQFAKSEPSCHGKHNGQYGHGSHHAGIGQRRCKVHQIVFGKAFNDDNQKLQTTVKPSAPLAQGRFVNIPYKFQFVKLYHGRTALLSIIDLKKMKKPAAGL